MLQGKYNLELNFPGDGRIFLNFWDSIQGNDVIAEVINGELELTSTDHEGNETYSVITFEEYIELVKSSINQRKP